MVMVFEQGDIVYLDFDLRQAMSSGDVVRRWWSATICSTASTV